MFGLPACYFTEIHEESLRRLTEKLIDHLIQIEFNFFSNSKRSLKLCEFSVILREIAVPARLVLNL